MKQEVTDSNVVDLCEELLYERAAMGIRPVLYVSSRKDLECSVRMLLHKESELRLPIGRTMALRGFNRHII